MDDTISRQAAIDEMLRLEQEDIEAYGVKIPEGFDAEPAVKALEALPSALVRCRDCQWYSEEHRMCTEHGIEDRDDDGYCSDGVQRRGDGDGADGNG